MTGHRLAMKSATRAVAKTLGTQKTVGTQSSPVAGVQPRRRLLIASESSLLRQALRELLDGATDLHLIGETDLSYEQLSAALNDSSPDVVVIHLHTYSHNNRLDERILPLLGSTSSILLTSGPAELVDLPAAARSGAVGFVDDRLGTSELLSAIAAVLSGHAWVSPALAKSLLEHFRSNTADLTQERPGAAVLSGRELDVVRLIGQGRSNIEIAGELTLAESTIKTHVSRMLRKLGLRDRTQLARYAYEHNIL
ncbi:LuxR C-terminal-related transcriptional regulator [Amycolatopsis sp. 3B14]|uniref:LuxR C-terminal-related transcriptional regulator n=1 Tax=Amycolatopsis sp. 3B14 TaxID=3243600 RepID=UPI003D960BD7